MINMVKRIIKYTIAVFLYYSGILSILEIIKSNSRKGVFPIVLMYHRVIENYEKSDLQPGLYVERSVFEKQINYLSNKYILISMAQYNSSLKNERPLPRKTMLITFDDGWRDNYLVAFPILKKYGKPATIFLSAKHIGSNYVFWFQELSALLSQSSLETEKYSNVIKGVLKNCPESPSARELLREDFDTLVSNRDRCIEKFKTLEVEIINEIIVKMKEIKLQTPINIIDDRLLLNWEEVREMSGNKIGFESHGLTHRLLTTLDPEEIRSELTQSRILIEKKLGRPVTAFSYPNGNYNTEIKNTTKEAGYVCAFIVGKRSAENRKLDRFAIERVGIHNDISIGILGKYSRAMFALHIYRKS